MLGKKDDSHLDAEKHHVFRGCGIRKIDGTVGTHVADIVNENQLKLVSSIVQLPRMCTWRVIEAVKWWLISFL
ncbi:hypothetical protein Nepgr_004841 [Nepenthes gracilis]|uniref:Uncharacterized protein n=1 Tax=Nepenthes gracilis TaxID=150966 RepID=A0AAD3S2D7_NEPGR|nr:hypothetical protein Nepgr_004841 [Nepenthes gracilis]